MRFLPKQNGGETQSPELLGLLDQYMPVPQDSTSASSRFRFGFRDSGVQASCSSRCDRLHGQFEGKPLLQRHFTAWKV